jgi:hypothetical protein
MQVAVVVAPSDPLAYLNIYFLVSNVLNPKSLTRSPGMIDLSAPVSKRKSIGSFRGDRQVDFAAATTPARLILSEVAPEGKDLAT